jgi:hypothetical protein
MRRGVAQLVARTAGGREVAGSSPVTPTKELLIEAARLGRFWRLIIPLKYLVSKHFGGLR